MYFVIMIHSNENMKIQTFHENANFEKEIIIKRLVLQI